MGCSHSRALGEAPGPQVVCVKDAPVGAAEPSGVQSAGLEARSDSPKSSLDLAEGCYKPDSEKDRLQALLECKCLDTPDERRFDSITALVKDMFQVPIAVVGLIDDERLWLKSIMGVEGRQGRRLHSFCDASLRSPNPTMMVVPDTKLDARFHGSQFVCESPYVRFYTGAPLVSSEGHILGSLGIMDIKPRSFPPGALNMICNFAELVVRELERDRARERMQSGMVERALSARGHMVRALSCFQEAVMLCNVADPGWPMLYVNENWCSDTGYSEPACLHSAFWDLFNTPLNSSGADSGAEKQAALKAAQERQPFSITVEGGPCSRMVLDLRPATADHLSAAMPTVGIPNFVEGLAPSELKVLDSYFFAIIRQPQEQVLSGAASSTSSACAPSSSVGGQTERRTVQQRTSEDSGTKSSRGTGTARTGGGSALASFLHRDMRSLVSYTHRPFDLDPPETLQGLKMGPLLGKGAYGKVYRGTWKSASVAVKIMESWVDPQSAEVTQPMMEALLSKNLSHPNVVQTFDFAFHIFEPSPALESDPASPSPWYPSHDQPAASPGARHRQQQVWIVQQYCNHGTLGDAVDRGWLRTRRTLDGPPCMNAILPTAQEIASALQYLHSQDVIHGDLAPGNVLLVGGQPQRRSDPRAFHAKVGDFGLSRLSSGEHALGVGSTAGTVSHMPPEVVEKGLLTKAADVYSFGVLCHEMVTGRRAWAGRTGVQILVARSTKKERLEVPAGCPLPFKALIEACLRDELTQRPTFDDIVGELADMMLLADGAPSPTAAS